MNIETRVGLAIAKLKDYSGESIYNNTLLISQLVRDAMIQGGLGTNNPDKPPADIIQPGMIVLLKPNWILHYNGSLETMDCADLPTIYKEANLDILAKILFKLPSSYFNEFYNHLIFKIKCQIPSHFKDTIRPYNKNIKQLE
jgi:hypothetical protein